MNMIANAATNCNPETGVRFGYISTQLLNPDLVHELLYIHGTDQSYKEAYEEAKKGYIREFDAAEEECKIAASEEDHNMLESEREDFIAKRMLSEHGIDTDEYSPETWAEFKLEQFSDMYSCDEPSITGTHEGVTYASSWLGGALNLFIFSGPKGLCQELCSLCVPNAGNLDKGFILPGETPADDETYSFECYVVPRDWMAESDPQYKLGV